MLCMITARYTCPILTCLVINREYIVTDHALQLFLLILNFVHGSRKKSSDQDVSLYCNWHILDFLFKCLFTKTMEPSVER